MTGTRGQPRVCGDCGCLIGDERAHRKFHRTLPDSPRVTLARGFVGQPEPPDAHTPPKE